MGKILHICGEFPAISDFFDPVYTAGVRWSGV